MAIVSSSTIAQWDKWVLEEHTDHTGEKHYRTYRLGENETPVTALAAYAAVLVTLLEKEEIERELGDNG